MQTVSVQDAVAGIPSEARLLIGSFMAVGTPQCVTDGIVCQGKRDLTVIASDTAQSGVGMGKLISARLVKRDIASHIGLNLETQQQMMRGELAVDLVPQGTLIERIRAAGYGVGVLTRTGVGTIVEEDKQKITLNGRPYLLEVAFGADFALLQAFLPEYLGNLPYVLTDRNFNPIVAMAGTSGSAISRRIQPAELSHPVCCSRLIRSTPYGIASSAEQTAVLPVMMENQAVARAVMVTAAASPFAPASPIPARVPECRNDLAETHGFFEWLPNPTYSASEGIWLGRPPNLNLERRRQELAPRMTEIGHEHLVLWDEADGRRSNAELRPMAGARPHCRAVTVPGTQ